MKPSNSTAPDAWRAEAVRHRLLRRVLPAQRHEVLGALSAQKMLLVVLRHRLERGPLDADSLLEQVHQIIEQQKAAQQALVELRVWDGLVEQHKPLATLLSQVDLLARQACAMKGHRLEIEPAVEMADLPVPAALYALLGLVFQACDSQQQASTLRCSSSRSGEVLRVRLCVERQHADDEAGENGPAAPQTPADPAAWGGFPSGNAVPALRADPADDPASDLVLDEADLAALAADGRARLRRLTGDLAAHAHGTADARRAGAGHEALPHSVRSLQAWELEFRLV